MAMLVNQFGAFKDPVTESLLGRKHSLHFGIDSNFCENNVRLMLVKLSDKVEVTASSPARISRNHWF